MKIRNESLVHIFGIEMKLQTFSKFKCAVTLRAERNFFRGGLI